MRTKTVASARTLRVMTPPPIDRGRVAGGTLTSMPRAYDDRPRPALTAGTLSPTVRRMTRTIPVTNRRRVPNHEPPGRVPLIVVTVAAPADAPNPDLARRRNDRPAAAVGGPGV